MSWRDQLQPASFRGVAFYVSSDSSTFGRRTVLHEYPYRDLPYVEDMGRRAREIRVTGLVIGDDYIKQRDALIDACEQAGSGRLVHPQYGELNVSVTDSGVTFDHSTDEAGLSRFNFSCIESGEAKFPAAISATQDVVQLRSGSALDALMARFRKAFRLLSLPAFAFTDALNRVNAFVNRVRDLVAPFIDAAGRGLVLSAIERLLPKLNALMSQPEELARELQAVIELVRLAAPPEVADRALAELATFDADDPVLPINVITTLPDGYGAGRPPTLPTTETGRLELANRQALNELVRGSAAAIRARAVLEIEFTDIVQATLVRDSVIAHVDVVADDTPDDVVFDALTALRAAVVRDIAVRGADLARIVRYTPLATAPALVIAYRLHDDAERDVELVARNHIEHPGFVPGNQPLEIALDV